MSNKEILRRWNKYFLKHKRKGKSFNQIKHNLIINHGYEYHMIERLSRYYLQGRIKNFILPISILAFIMVISLILILNKPTYTGYPILTIQEGNASCIDSCLASTNIVWEQFPMKNQWQNSNGDSGGEGFQMVFDIDWNKHDTDILYLVSDTTKVWKSTDRGNSWFMIGNNIPVKGGSSIASDPHNPEIVFLAASTMSSSSGFHNSNEGIYRSTDGGLNWTLVSQSYYEKEWHGKQILIDPASYDGSQSTIIYTGTNDSLKKSTDGGMSWTDVALLGYYIYDIEWSSGDRSNIYASTDAGLYRIRLSDYSETLLGVGLPSFPWDTWVSPTDSNIIYAAVSNGIYKSTDSGSTFTAKNSGLSTTKSYRYITASEIDPDIMIASPHKSGGNNPYWSDNAGESWHQTSYASQEMLHHGYYYGKNVIFDPDDQQIAIMQTGGPIVKTFDGGKTWNFSSSGYTGARLVDIDFIDNETMLFCLTDKGLFLTENGGNSFSDLAIPRINNAISCGSVDSSGDTIIASSGGWTSQDIIKSDNFGGSWSTVKVAGESFNYIRFHPNNTDVVYADKWISINGGATWGAVSDGYEIRAMDPGNGDVYGYKNIGGNNWQVAVSTDYGSSWTPVGSTVSTSSGIRDLSYDPFSIEPHLLAAAGYYGVYEYKDGSWTLRKDSDGLPQGSNYVFVRFDPSTQDVAWTGRQGVKTHGIGVFLSLDGGTSWNNQINNLGPYNDFFNLEVSNYDNTVYLTGPGIWKTSLKEICGDCFPGNMQNMTNQTNTTNTTNSTNTTNTTVPDITGCTLEDHVWYINQTLEDIYDLSACFNDPLNQTMNYTSEGNIIISVTISSSGKVNLSSTTPATEYITFTAYGTKNRNASTNLLNLTALNLTCSNCTQDNTTNITNSSTNTTNTTNTSLCGDDVCNGTETCSSCSIDCGSCPNEESPSGGGGGGSGGGGPTTPKNSRSKSWKRFLKDDTVEWTFSDFEVYHVTGRVVQKTDNPELTVTMLDEAPQEIEHPDSTETFLNISPTNLELTDIKIRFKLPKESSTGKTVTLSRYTSDWIDLPTEEIYNDTNYTYYSADSPGFSYFAIRVEGDESDENNEQDSQQGSNEAVSHPVNTESPNNIGIEKITTKEAPKSLLEPVFQRFEGILSVALFIFLFTAALVLSLIVINYWNSENPPRE